MFRMDKENKFSAYWVLNAIKDNMKRSVLFATSVVLLAISCLLAISTLKIFNIFSVFMVVYTFLLCFMLSIWYQC